MTTDHAAGVTTFAVTEHVTYPLISHDAQAVQIVHDRGREQLLAAVLGAGQAAVGDIAVTAQKLWWIPDYEVDENGQPLGAFAGPHEAGLLARIGGRELGEPSMVQLRYEVEVAPAPQLAAAGA